MPFPNEHAARLIDPKKFVSFNRKNDQGGPGVDFIFGVTPEGKVEIHTIRFRSDKFTPKEAHAWLKEHDFHPIMFEDAIKKADETIHEPAMVDLYVVDVVKSNDRHYAEAAYILDGTKGLERNNLILIDESIDTEVELKKGQVISVSCAGVEPTHVHGKFGVKLVNAFFAKVNTDRKTPDTTKQILQKADYAESLLASDFMRLELSAAGLIRNKGLRSITVEQTEGSDQAVVKHEFPFYKDAKKKIIYGIVYEPDVADTQGDITSAEEIEKAAHTFLEDYNAHNLMHQAPLGVHKVKTCESYIAPADFIVGGQLIRKGSWVLASHVYDNDLWDAIEKGYINAYSMEGTGQSADLTKRDNSTEIQVQKRYLVNMVIKAVALVDKGANRKKFFLMKREDTPMDKAKLLLLVKSAKLTVAQIELIGKEIGLKQEEIVEIAKTAEAPAGNDVAAIIKASMEEVKQAIITAVTEALDSLDKGEGAQKTPEELAAEAAAAAAGAVDEMPEEMKKEPVAKRAAWYMEHPNADVSDDCMEAVIDLIGKKKAEAK